MSTSTQSQLRSLMTGTVTRWRRALTDDDAIPPLMITELVAHAEQHARQEVLEHAAGPDTPPENPPSGTARTRVRARHI